MEKRIFVGIVVFLMLISLLPSIALAQPGLPSRFMGSVTVNGMAAPDGTVVTAHIDDDQVGFAVVSGGEYLLNVSYLKGKDGDIIVFRIDGAEADQTSTWEGGIPKVLDLTAIVIPPGAGDPKIVLSPSEGMATNIKGTGFVPNSLIMLTWEGGGILTSPEKLTVDQAAAFEALIVAPTSVPGEYTISASDTLGRSAEAIFTIVSSRGEQGLQGETGLKGDHGEPGKQGEPGKDGSGAGTVLGIVAIVIAVIAVILAFLFRSKRPSLRKGP